MPRIEAVDKPHIRRCCPPGINAACKLWTVQIKGYSLGQFPGLTAAAGFTRTRHNWRSLWA